MSLSCLHLCFMIATGSIIAEEAEAELGAARHCLSCCPQMALNIVLQTLHTASKCWVIERELDDFHQAFFFLLSFPFFFFFKLSDLILNLWSVFRNEIL